MGWMLYGVSTGQLGSFLPRSCLVFGPKLSSLLPLPLVPVSPVSLLSGQPLVAATLLPSPSIPSPLPFSCCVIRGYLCRAASEQLGPAEAPAQGYRRA